MQSAYAVPEERVIVETEVKRSRFIALLAPVSSRAEAMAVVEEMRKLYPDARHHCWAYVIGNPDSAAEAGMSDDGEPQGTAGKPILNVLQHKKVGDIVAVVSRYFGGIKLGAGGLVRAYSAAAQAAYDQLPLKQIVPTVPVSFSIDYPLEKDVRHLLAEAGLLLAGCDYGEQVTVRIDVPLDLVDEIRERLTNQCKGDIAFAGA